MATILAAAGTDRVIAAEYKAISVNTFCPFCNAPLSQAGDGPGIRCARCGEPLPASFTAATPGCTSSPGDTSGLSTTSPARFPPKPVKANRRVALIVLGIMVAMAGGGLVLALATQQFRRNNDFRRGATPNIVIQPPSEWPALGYLPRDTNVIAGVHVAGLKHDPLGKRFFELPRPPVFDLILEAVEQFAHVKPDGIDHVVFGAEVTSKLPQFVFAVRTVTRFDADELSKGLAAPKLSYRGHTAFRLPMKPASGLLYCPDERTLVGLIRLDPVELKDLEEIPAPPRNGCEGLSATLVEALTRHLDKQSLAFAAGDLEKAAALRDFLGFTTLRPAAADALAGVRWFGLALYPQDGWTLSGAFFTGDASSAQVLHAFLKGLNFTGAGSVKLTGPHAEEPAPQARLVQLQVRAGPEGFQELLRTVRLPLPK